MSAPSMRQVARDVGVPLYTTYKRLLRLRDLGLVEWQPRRHRTMRLTPRGKEIAAGLAARREGAD